MDKKTEDFQVENMLENWQKKPLDPTALLAAQDRVWSKLSTSLNLTTPNMSSQNNSSTPQTSSNIKPWYFKPLNLSLAAFSLVLILVGTGGILYLNQQNQKLNEQLALQKQVDKNLNPIARTDLSIDQIKGLATQKLNALTNGVPLSQIESTVAKQADDMNSMASSRLSSAQLTESKNTSTADKQAAENLVKEKGITDKVIYYTETINEDVEPGYSYGYLSSNPNYDKSKPVKTQSWVGSNYSKYITSQDDKILSYNIYAIDYMVDYRGGKYAIKENFDQSQYLRTFTEQAQVDNSELSWLKNLLSDKAIKDEGIQQINGKEYRVLATDPIPYAGVPEPMVNSSMPVQDTYTTKYYIDLAKFTLFKTENYTNSKLVSTSTQTAYQEFQNPNLVELFSSNDLKVEVKEVQSPPNDPYTSNLVEFSGRYAILYPDYLTDRELKESLYTYDNSKYNDLPSVKLRNTLDFDPGLDMTMIDSYQNPLLASFNFQSTSFAMYKEKPNYLQKEYIVKTENVKIRINNRPVDATYQLVRYNLEFDSNNKPKAFSTTSKIEGDTDIITFQYNGLWYELNSYQYQGSPSNFNINTLNLLSPSSQTITDIANYQTARDLSYPKIESVNLESITSNLRLLPGDLSKSDKLFLSDVSKSTRAGLNATCTDFPNGIYGISGCLQEKYNGFSLSYNMFYDSNSPEVSASPNELSYFNVVVLDRKIPEAELTKYIENINNTSLEADKVDYSNKDNVITLGNTNYGTYVYIFTAGDKNVIINSTLQDGQPTPLNRLGAIVSGLSLDKDIEILKSQLAENRKLNPIMPLQNK